MSSPSPGTATYPNRSAHRLLEAAAADAPDATALRSALGRVRYRDLNTGANRVADALRTRGIGPGSVVGLFSAISFDSIIAAVGVLKTGATVLPLDDAQPLSRLRYILGDAGPEIVLTTAHAGWEDRRVRCVPVEECLAAGTDEEADSSADVPLDSVASIMYTSGSTGLPKGVARTHRSIVHRLAWMRFEPGDVFCHNMSLTVGFSLERLFLPLMTGLPLALIPEDLHLDPGAYARAIDDLGVTHITVVPSVLAELIKVIAGSGASFERLRTVAVGGAPLGPDLIPVFRQALPHVRLENAYGTTESGSVIRGPVGEIGAASSVPIGWPVAGVWAGVLDDQMRPVPDQQTGELYVAGPCLARGYLNQPGETAQRFLEDPGRRGRRMYRTGDLSRRLPDGRFEILGRMDRQLSIHGHRVEPAEVETVICSHPAVEEVVVVGSGETLHAYIVPNGPLASRDLRAYLRSRLPRFMVPATLTRLDALPRTLNGKIDVAALGPPGRPGAGVGPPASPTEKAIERIWREALSLDRIGIDEEFLQMGGHSLAAIRVLTAIQETFNVEVSFGRFLELSTIREVSREIERLISGGGQTDAAERILRISRRGFLPLSFLQEERLHHELWARIDGRPHVQFLIRSCLHLHGPLVPARLEDALDTCVQRHEALRSRFVPTVNTGRLYIQGWTALSGAAVGRPDLDLEGADIDIDLEILPACGVPIDHVDLSALDGPGQEVELGRLIEIESKAVLDYDDPPLVRAVLVRLSSERHVLLLTLSHLVCDGWSLRILQDEIAELYDAGQTGRTPALADPPIHYVDFAAWQRRYFHGDRVREAGEYWALKFSEFLGFDVSHLDLPPPPPGSPGFSMDSEGLWLDRDLAASVCAFAREHDVTLHTLFLTVTAMALNRYGDKPGSVSFMTYFANRQGPRIRNVVGWFVHAWPVTVRLTDRAGVAEILRRVRETVEDADRHHRIPLTMLRNLLEGVFGPDSTRRLAAFSYVGRLNENSTNSLSIRQQTLTSTQSEWAALRITVTEGAATRFEVAYRTDTVSRAGARAIVAEFEARLRGLVGPEARFGGDGYGNLRRRR